MVHRVGNGDVKLDAKTDQVEHIGGTKYSVRAGIVCDAKKLLADGEGMVERRSQKRRSLSLWKPVPLGLFRVFAPVSVPELEAVPPSSRAEGMSRRAKGRDEHFPRGVRPHFPA